MSDRNISDDKHKSESSRHRHSRRNSRSRSPASTRRHTSKSRSPDPKRQRRSDHSDRRSRKERHSRSRSPQSRKERRSRSRSPHRHTDRTDRSKNEKSKYSSSSSHDHHSKSEDEEGNLPEHSTDVVKTAESTNLALERLRTAAKSKLTGNPTGPVRPVFLTKKQRELLVVKEEKEEEETKRETKRLEKKAREVFLKQTEMESRKERDRERTQKREEQKQEKEMEQIKAMYLGDPKRKKKRTIVPSQKFRFNFDWDAKDDTTADDTNPLYSQRHEVQFGFGRDFIAGMDRAQQRKKNRFYDELVEKRLKGGLVETPLVDDVKFRERQDREKEKEEKKAKSSRHWSDKLLDEMTERDWRIFKEDYNITTRGGKLPKPIRNWGESPLPDYIKDAVQQMKYNEPMPIQRQTIPIGLGNRDLIGIAETGSGKTAAFLIPMIVYIADLPPMNPETALEGPYSIILAPTRELALQIYEECVKFTKYTMFRAVPIVGGVPIDEQAVLLRNGAEVVIATPGRLADCLRSRYIVLNQCNYVVLDEADRMLDMGFEPQVIEILEAMPSTNLKPAEYEDDSQFNKTIYRQTIMFSATMPTRVEFIAKNYLRNPAFVSIGDSSGKAVDKIEQTVIFLKENQKRNKLLVILEKEDPPIIVFCNSRKNCDGLMKFLEQEGHNCIVIHGGKSQDQREDALGRFKDGKGDILVATDVAGRGIDVEGVTNVINFDMAKNIDSYTHRIGRTGRAGREGKAVTFITEDDNEVFFDLKTFLTKTNAEIPADLARHEAAQHPPGDVNVKKKGPKIVYAKK